MKIGIFTANLGGFDDDVDSVEQELPQGVTQASFYRFTDSVFAPITGLTPRLQYRIPKLFAWEMQPQFDIYIWLDASFAMHRSDSVTWFLDKLGNADAAFFLHPQRNSMQEEVYHIEQKLEEGNRYITTRYKNGLHREMLECAYRDMNFIDDVLYTSTAFIYRVNERTAKLMMFWWYYQSRYFTCDQVALPYAVYKSKAVINRMPENQYKIPFLTLVSHHK